MTFKELFEACEHEGYEILLDDTYTISELYPGIYNGGYHFNYPIDSYFNSLLVKPDKEIKYIKVFQECAVKAYDKDRKKERRVKLTIVKKINSEEFIKKITNDL